MLRIMSVLFRIGLELFILFWVDSKRAFSVPFSMMFMPMGSSNEIENTFDSSRDFSRFTLVVGCLVVSSDPLNFCQPHPERGGGSKSIYINIVSSRSGSRHAGGVP